MKKVKTLLVMAGGTGGHVFPGLAVADKLKKQGWQVSWLGTAARMESKLVPEYGYEIDFIDVAGVRGNGIKRLLMAPLQIIKSIFQARKVLKERQVDLVLGMGGFASGPGGIAAWTLGIPVILHEQNAAAGMTNRLLAKFSKKLLMGFSGAFVSEKAILVGNPIREALLNLPPKVISKIPASLKILVVGGSLGAKILNEIVPKALMNFNLGDVSVLHQTGKGHFESVNVNYQTVKVDYEIQEFIVDMAQAYAWADIIICRAGALTVAEVAVVGLPALFIPLPHAVDDHQTKNAQSLVNAGAATLISQSMLTDVKLNEFLYALSQNRDMLIKMSENCKNVAIRDATEQVAAVCNSLV